MPYFIVFQLFVWFFAFLFLSNQLDQGRMMEARTIVQGGLDAAVLAGAHMQEKIPIAYDSFSNPVQWKHVIEPGRADAKALELWLDNVEHYYNTPLYDSASLADLDFSVSPDQTELTGTIVIKMNMSSSTNFIKSIFGSSSDYEVEIPVKAKAQVKPENGKIITP